MNKSICIINFIVTIKLAFFVKKTGLDTRRLQQNHKSRIISMMSSYLAYSFITMTRYDVDADICRTVAVLECAKYT